MNSSDECTNPHKGTTISNQNNNADKESNEIDDNSNNSYRNEQDNNNCVNSDNKSKIRIKISNNDTHSSHFDGIRRQTGTSPSDRSNVSLLTPCNTNFLSSASPNKPTQLNCSSANSPLRPENVHETIYAQSLLLALTFMAIWFPSNIMAPNLTQIADNFDMSDSERDLYLGTYCALATGVLSFPISATIGVATDVYSRKTLFVGTAIAGALSSSFTGLSQNYTWLFCARLLNGGFMSASVPIAFSLLGDLFATEERNIASSCLTAMMGVGILVGQVYAGMVGEALGWSHAFYVSCILTLLLALLVSLLIKEPVRGGKEKVLQDMLTQGTKYEKRLTWDGFVHAMRHNTSNKIIIWQGFFSSLPWGVIFIFLNDILLQERGFSVAEATKTVFLFGIGCAIGGLLGGYWGAICQSWNRSYLPLFMSITTFLGIFPFLALLDAKSYGFVAIGSAVLAGMIASLPSVSVRPCLISVNPPETRGAALTAANLIINLARGIGPSCVTAMTAIWKVDRIFSFNVTLVVFWTISAIQLFFLARSLPKDQDEMEDELADYAEKRILTAKQEKRLAHKNKNLFHGYQQNHDSALSGFEDTYAVSLFSRERQMISNDDPARESLTFVRTGRQEMEFRHCAESSGDEDDRRQNDYYECFSAENERNNISDRTSDTSSLSSSPSLLFGQQQNTIQQDQDASDKLIDSNGCEFDDTQFHTETTYLLV